MPSMELVVRPPLAPIEAHAAMLNGIVQIDQSRPAYAGIWFADQRQHLAESERVQEHVIVQEQIVVSRRQACTPVASRRKRMRPVEAKQLRTRRQELGRLIGKRRRVVDDDDCATSAGEGGETAFELHKAEPKERREAE